MTTGEQQPNHPYICLWDSDGRKGHSCRLIWRDPFEDQVAMKFSDGFVLILAEQAFGIDWPKLKCESIVAKSSEGEQSEAAK